MKPRGLMAGLWGEMQSFKCPHDCSENRVPFIQSLIQLMFPIKMNNQMRKRVRAGGADGVPLRYLKALPGQSEARLSLNLL